MRKRKNHTDEQFRKHLRQFEASPPEEIWTGISSALDQKRRKQRMVVFWRMAASVAVLLSLGTMFFLLRQGPERTVAEREETLDTIRQASRPGILATAPEEKITESPETGTVESPQEPYLAGAGREPVIARDEPPPLQFIHPYEAGLFENRIPETRLLMTQAYPVPAKPEMGEGIDLFEEWGEQGQDSYDRWAVGTQVTPLYSYRSVESSSGSVPSESYYNQVEDGMLTYSGGVNVNYSPRKRLTLQSGLYYSKMGLKVGSALYARDGGSLFMSSMGNNLLVVSNSSGTIKAGAGSVRLSGMSSEQQDAAANFTDISNISTYPTTSGEVIQHFEYLELPVIMRYRVVDRKVGFNVLGGLSANFLVGSDAFFQQNGEREFLGTTGDLKTVNYSSVFGVGINYVLSSKWNLNFEPVFRYYLNSINAYSGLKSHPYSLGFYTGLSYSF